MPLILASESPRRRELLALLGLPFDIAPADIDEKAAASPAAAKLAATARPATVTIAADTEIDLDGVRVGKPRDTADARDILSRLAGRAHEVVTEVALRDAAGRDLRFAVRARVTMAPFDGPAVDRYVATGEPADKAGAYAIQGEGRALVTELDGCLANVVGLPLCHLAGALRRAGVTLPERAADACQRHFAFTCPVWRTAAAQAHSIRQGASYRTQGQGVLYFAHHVSRHGTVEHP